MFYVAKNCYSTESSIGFCNTWYVVGFKAKKDRETHFQSCPQLATRKIAANEIKKYGGVRGQISFYDADGNYHQYGDAT